MPRDHKKYYHDNIEKLRAYHREWTAKNCDRLRAKQNAKWRKECATLKAAIVGAYGGCCACCGEKNSGFLTIDHINNDGYLDRPASGNSRGGHKLWRRLRREGFPKENFRLLCWNCNSGRAYTKDKICPHYTQMPILGLSAALLF